MADKTIEERLQPSLLDRLTDHDPSNPKEAATDRVIDMRRLREIIRRDLGWLLNNNNLESTLDPHLHKNVLKSVVNYGVREVSGDFSTEERAERMRQSIHRAIALFEPRIKPGTLDVTLSADERGSETVIEFNIHADMWAQPLPLELYLRSQIDLVSGHVELERVS